MGQRVLRGSTATLETYPPVLAQATGTPTARIGTASVPLPDAGSNATVDSVSTEVSGDAYAGRVEVAVDSATWVRGRQYIAESTTGDLFPIMASTDGAADTLYLKEPLPTALLTDSTIKGYRISIALTALQTADIGDQCVVEWTATLNGVTMTWSETFEVVARDGAYTLNAVTLSQSSPFCRRMGGDTDPDFSEMIDAAWRRYVKPALLAKGIRPGLFISRDELEPAHIAACEHFAAQNAIDMPADVREEKRREWAQALDLVLSSTTLWIDTAAQDLTPPDPEAPREWAMTTVWR